MIKDDDRKIWEARLIKESVITEDHGARGCPEIEKLIASATEEDAEGRETINVDNEPEAFDEVDEHTPL
tara:strand:- start:43 stop:249 length:207 start_codon:yes stop_codon:yes gene_type:complete